MRAPGVVLRASATACTAPGQMRGLIGAADQVEQAGLGLLGGFPGKLVETERLPRGQSGASWTWACLSSHFSRAAAATIGANSRRCNRRIGTDFGYRPHDDLVGKTRNNVESSLNVEITSIAGRSRSRSNRRRSNARPFRTYDPGAPDGPTLDTCWRHAEPFEDLRQVVTQIAALLILGGGEIGRMARPSDDRCDDGRIWPGRSDAIRAVAVPKRCTTCS